ncbi:MAG: hotdog fold thioesterase [Actinobacteria bacterium]|nr:hotdog fold thioesterase [Actinomycetota bacterium]
MNSNQENQASAIQVGAMAERMGITVSFATANKVVGHMPVEGNTQPFGVGAHLHAGPTRSVVGIDINGTHHRSATAGQVTGTATPLSLGRTIAVYEIVITDERDKRICTARLTCLLRELNS